MRCLSTQSEILGIEGQDDEDVLDGYFDDDVCVGGIWRRRGARADLVEGGKNKWVAFVCGRRREAQLISHGDLGCS